MFLPGLVYIQHGRLETNDGIRLVDLVDDLFLVVPAA
jgi:hypothetical protein